jgi:RNA polymerase sigma-70 factor (ECF subfamily)
MKPLNNDDIVLIEEAQKGKDAFEQLVRRYRHDVFRIIRVYTKNDTDAEDLSQETWIKVYQSLRKV